MDTQIISPVSRDWLRRPLSGKVIQSRLKSDQPSGQEALPELIQSFFILLSSSFSLFPRTPATPLPQSLVCWCRCLGGSSHEAGSRTSGCLRSRGQASPTATSIVEVRALCHTLCHCSALFALGALKEPDNDDIYVLVF